MIGRVLLWVSMIALAVIGVGFSMLNNTPVQINYHYGIQEFSLAWVVGSAICLGLFVGLLVSLTIVLGMKRRISKLNRAHRKSIAKGDHLRTIPLRNVA